MFRSHVGIMTTTTATMTTSQRSLCGRWTRHWAVVVWSALSLLTFVWSFNVDTSKPIIYKGPSGSYFGYSVAMLENRKGGW